MLTKPQKAEQVAAAKKLLAASRTLIFADFSGVPTKMVNTLKRQLKAAGVSYRVFRKRLLKVAFGEAGITYDPMQFESPAAVIATPGDLPSVAGAIYQFARAAAKEKKNFRVLGAYDLALKAAVSVEEFTAIAKLPSREVLLGAVLGAVTAPLRAFMYSVEQIAKGKAQMVEPST